MTWKVKLLPLSQTDITESVAWYDEQQAGLGDRFFDALADSLHLLKGHPQMFQIFHKTIRQAPVKKFPFSIFYRLDEATHLIVVLAVLHNSRNPRVWKGRAK